MTQEKIEQKTVRLADADKEKLQDALKGVLEAKDQEKGKLQQVLDSFNSWASLLAAGLGILITIQTLMLGGEVDRLKENVDTSSLVGELIASLTGEAQKQDIALLALEHALTDELQDKQRSKRNKELVAEIAAKILENSYKQLGITGEEGARVELEQSGKTARKILQKLSEGGDPKNCDDNFAPKSTSYSKIAQVSLNQYHCRSQQFVEAVKSPSIIGRVESPSIIAGVTDMSSIENDDTGTTSILKLEGADIADSASETADLALITQTEAVSMFVEESNEKQEPSNLQQDIPGVIYLHYDQPSLKNAMDTLKMKLESTDNPPSVGTWFVPGKIELVGSDEFNCSTRTDIRFFHESDQSFAKDLQAAFLGDRWQETNASNQRELSGDLGAIFANNTIDTSFRLVDLSNWSRAVLVPKKQLEIWIVSEGEACQSSRAARETRAAVEQFEGEVSNDDTSN